MSKSKRLPPSPDLSADILRRAEERLEVGYATVLELATVTGTVDTAGEPHRHIDDWRVIALRDRTTHRVTLHVVGRFKDSNARMSSRLAVLAQDHSRVWTRDSVYSLGEPAKTQSDLDLSLDVLRALRSWGGDRWLGHLGEWLDRGTAREQASRDAPK
jgi:hypothetical protein